ncbi:hypothetical protein RB595_005943 [Gaeumannomyces hyphopodioides]
MSSLTAIEKRMVELAQSKLSDCKSQIETIDALVDVSRKHMREAVENLDSASVALSATEKEERSIGDEIASLSTEFDEADIQFQLAKSKRDAALKDDRQTLARKTLSQQHFNVAWEHHKIAKQALFRKRARLSHLSKVEKEQKARYDEVTQSLDDVLEEVQADYDLYERELSALWRRMEVWEQIVSPEELAGYEAGVGKINRSADSLVRSSAEEVFSEARRELN